METKHTKGEWEIYKNEFDNFIIVSNGFYIGEMRNEADAKLIAAAPDLLEALKEVCESKGKGITAELIAYDKAAEAIKKATN